MILETVASQSEQPALLSYIGYHPVIQGRGRMITPIALIVATGSRQASVTLVVALIAVIAVVVIAVLLIVRKIERDRTEALRQVSLTLGFAFEENGDVEQIRALGDLPLFGHGHGKRAKNVMNGRTDAGDVRVMDYQYTTGGGKSSHTWRQTIALYPGSGRGLPDFEMWPENRIFRALGRVLKWQDINFDSNPVFSSSYILRGPDEAAVRAAFTGEMLAFFEGRKGWTVQVRSGSVGIFHAEQRVKPEAIGQFLEETSAVLRGFARV